MSASAQEEFTPSRDIFFGEPVSESIESGDFFDRWRFYGVTGNIYFVRMVGVNGLAPLIGVLDAGGDLLARSEDGIVNGEVTVRFTAPTDGYYIIVATRVGNETGTTTGDYGLQIDWLNPPPTRDPLYQDITFDCEGQSVTAAISLRMYPDADRALFVRAYGLDGFRPVIHYRYDATGETGCSTERAIGDVITIPGENPIAITDGNADSSAALALPVSDGRAFVELIIGTRDDAPGRYVVLLGGLVITPTPTPTVPGAPRSQDSDVIEFRLAPRAGASRNPTSVYMIGEAAARLDPFMRIFNVEAGCDDAGRRAAAQSAGGCESMPPFVGGNISVADGSRYIGDRFDAGIQIVAGDTIPIGFEFTTFNRSTYGEYGAVILGEIPAR